MAAESLDEVYDALPAVMTNDDPSLFDDISPGLKARMQGKSCFNFKAVDTDLFAELGALTSVGATAFQRPSRHP